MDPSKKILILYASAGHGHEKAAKALLEACRAAGLRAEAHDTLELVRPAFIGDVYRKSYLFQINRAPALWGFFYYAFDAAWLYALIRPLRRLWNAWVGRPIEALLLEKDVAAVVATHFMAVEIAARLKRKGVLRARLVALITDYLPHWIWTARGVEVYAVAAARTKEAMRLRFGLSNVRVTGIPIGPQFSQLPSKGGARARLGLKEAFTVLLTSGGAAIGQMEALVSGILATGKAIQMQVVCGTNEALRRKLAALPDPKGMLKIYGFVDNMHELMTASDLLLGKGGGITITEAFAAGLPVLLFRPVPGQEGRNAACVAEEGAGLRIDSVKRVIAKVAEFAQDPSRLKPFGYGARRLAAPDAARDACRLAVEGL